LYQRKERHYKARVLKSGGKLILIDMEAAAEDLRIVQDEIEALRAPSHIRNLSNIEMLQLFSDHHFVVEIVFIGCSQISL